MSMCSPPSGLPAISPSRGEIGSFGITAHSATLQIASQAGRRLISPSEGKMAGRPEEGAPSPASEWGAN